MHGYEEGAVPGLEFTALLADFLQVGAYQCNFLGLRHTLSLLGWKLQYTDCQFLTVELFS